MEIKVQVVTPAMAQAWLDEFNIGNRHLTPARVTALAKDMSAGRFQLSHQGIAFSVDRLIDGQHRLAAIVKSGVPQTLLVVRGVNPSTYMVVDQGAKKSSGDIFGVGVHPMQVIRMGARIAVGSAITQSDVKTFIPVIGPHAEQFCTTTRKVLSSASVRLAGVVRIIEGEDASYIHGVYEQLVNARLADLPPIARSLVEQVLRGALHGSDDSLVLAKSFGVFTKTKANLEKVTVKDPLIYIARAREALRSELVRLG